jgi:predicted nucleotidyltransferase
LTNSRFHATLLIEEEAISMNEPQIASKGGEFNVAPFSGKIDFIRSLILGSVSREIIKKVYLFGSYAYGDPTEDSDIDLCVVIGNEHKRADIYLEIAMNLFENKIIPCDLMVYNEKYFHGAESGRGLENTIINNGVLLYG